MAHESEELEIQREMLRQSIQQTRYLSLLVETQAEILNRMRGVADPVAEARALELLGQESAIAEEDGLRHDRGIDLR